MYINNKIVEKLIKEKKYDELLDLLHQYFSTHDHSNKFYFYILRMVEQMDYIKALRYYSRPKVVYEYDYNYSLKRFHEAIKYRDYEEAYYLSDGCIQYLNKTNQSTYQISIYQLVLEDLVKIQHEKYEETNKKIQNKRKTERKTKSFDVLFKKLVDINTSYVKNFNETAISELKEVIDNILEINKKEDFGCMQLNYMKEIISLIEQIKEYKVVDENYFYNLDKDQTDFYNLLANGDYISAFEYIRQKNNKDKLSQNRNTLYTNIFLKLLKYLNRQLKNNKYKACDYRLTSEIIKEQLEYENYEQCLDTYINSNLKTDEEVISKVLILDNYKDRK